MPAFVHLGPRGLNFDQLSEQIKPVPLRGAQGRYLQLRIVNTAGRASLKSVRVSATLGSKDMLAKEGKPSR